MMKQWKKAQDCAGFVMQNKEVPDFCVGSFHILFSLPNLPTALSSFLAQHSLAHENNFSFSGLKTFSAFFDTS